MPKKFETIADFYKVKKLSDLLDEDEIIVMAAGFSDHMNLPIVLVELDENSQLKTYKPYRFNEFLHPNCIKARKEWEDKCEKQEIRDLERFVRQEGIKPAEFCWNDGVHFKKGIKVGGIPVALAIGGGYRIIKDITPTEEEKKCVEEISTYESDQMNEIIGKDCRFVLIDRTGKEVTWNEYKTNYDSFVNKVGLIERMARERFRSKRYDIENQFFDLVRPKTFVKEFHLLKEEKEFKEAYKWALERMNALCGYSKSVLMMYSKDNNIFKVYISTLKPEQQKEIISFQINVNWEKCFNWGKIIYIQPGLDQRLFDEKSKIDTDKLLGEINSLFPIINVKRCCIFPFTAEDSRWLFFFFYETDLPPFDDFFQDNKKLMENFCSRMSNGIARAYVEMDRRDYLDRVAHETMNPIGKVKWHAEYIKMTYNKIERKDVFRKLDDIINSCKRAVETAETILKLSGKIEIEIKLEKVDFFERIAKPVVHEVRYGREDLYIDYKNLVKMPILNIDFNLLYDVIFNMLHNAVKYSSKGTTIVFSYENKENGVVIFISNIGIGIPVGEDEKIFKPGGRGSNVSQIDVRGTGQGLAICKMYVEEKLGGIIWFERGYSTEQGKEIIFKVFLPKKYITGV